MTVYVVYIYLAVALIVGYFIGNINFARIFSKKLSNKDITKVGSKNPGTMNVLRTQGFARAMLTLVFEAIKVGVPALVCYFLFEQFFTGYGQISYFISSFGGILGHCFPVFYKFKGGKGVACTFGMFLFNPQFWWLSLIMFVVCFVLFLFCEYGYIVNLFFILVMSVYATSYLVLEQLLWWIIIIIIIWLNFIMIVILHRGNIKRTIQGTENKVNLREKIFHKKRFSSEEVKEEKSENSDNNLDVIEVEGKEVEEDKSQVEKEGVEHKRNIKGDKNDSNQVEMGVDKDVNATNKKGGRKNLKEAKEQTEQKKNGEGDDSSAVS